MQFGRRVARREPQAVRRETPRGRVIEKNIRKERMTADEVAAEARLQQIGSLDEVQWAVLESGGRVSFIPKSGRIVPRGSGYESAMLLKAWICLVVLVLPTVACGGGGTLSTKAFQKQAESLQSLAAEGGLVAQGRADARATGTFVSVQSEYLGKAARKVEKELSSAKASGSLEQKRKSALRLAGRVTAELEQLHRAPDDGALAERLASDLRDAADAAEKLAK